MKEITHVNDDTLNTGDIIAAYYSGYHRITRIEPRGEKQSHLIYFKTIAKANGQRVKSNVELCCNASYCRLAKAELDRSITKLEAELAALKNLREEFS